MMLFQQNHFDHCAWYMGHTSRWQIRLQWMTMFVWLCHHVITSSFISSWHHVKLPTFGKFWQLLTTFVNLLQYMAIYDNVWQSLATYANYWRLHHVWHLFGNIWQLLSCCCLVILSSCHFVILSSSQPVKLLTFELLSLWAFLLRISEHASLFDILEVW